MAAPMNIAVSVPVLSQKQRKALLKKERRSRKRQALAEARVSGQGDGDHTPEEEEKVEDNDSETEGQHREWLERELRAQEEFRLQMEREETARKKQEEEERRIKEEWEAQQRKEQEEKEQKQQQKKDREEAVQKMLDQAESQLAAGNGGPWMNAEPPDFGTEKDRDNCPFFIKTGACRFGDRCSRKHVHPESSPTLLVRGMFVTFGLDQSRRDDYDTDACLEYSEEEVQQQFLDFYQDVLPEFRTVGKVLQFKVSCNYEPHLRGNVYVQFDTEEQCREAFMLFNGRWYAGKQLQCELCPVTRWKTAICGLFDRQKCPKGKHCNFLHVFRNPGNEFWEADRDLHMSPDRSGGFSGRWSERRGRDWDHSWRSSLTRSERSHRGRERRSRSRERGGGKDRRGSARGREERSRSRERGQEGRSRSRERRSRERGREGRSRERERESRIEQRSRDRNGSRERAKERSREKRGCSRERRVRSRESSSLCIEKRSRREGTRSPEKPIMGDATPDDITTLRHYKHSKKGKKSKKKKHKKKKKSALPEDSSIESGKEFGEGEEAPDVVPIPGDPCTKSTNCTETNETDVAGEEAVSPDPPDPPLEIHSEVSPTPHDPEPISYPLKSATPTPIDTEIAPFFACAKDISVPPVSGVELI